MKVTVKMIGSFVYSAGFSEKTLDLSPGTTTDELLETLKIEKSRPMIVARNGQAVVPGERLEDGDRVVIAPIFSGG
ncbi:MAG: MoaD/ThiS family protein [Armatimonadetes bacterium]|nr:MoaD/ThiS family protein [Armatimonadota bacterium]